MFNPEVHTKDGFEYEPDSLKSMLAARGCHLKEHYYNVHNYKYLIIRDPVFIAKSKNYIASKENGRS